LKLNNLTIAPQPGILVGITLLGLCIANAREFDNQSGMPRSAVEGFPAKVRAA
jgi:hypothetical protein